jgi:hypothetical protein
MSEDTNQAASEGVVYPFARDGARDRSGNVNPAKERYAAEKQAKKEAKEREKMQQVMSSPASRAELQQLAFRNYAALEKMAAEVRRITIQHESMLRVLLENGALTQEQFEKHAQEQIEWNQFVDGIRQAYGSVPLRDLVAQVRDFNTRATLKVEWHHIDIAPHLLQDDALTLEDKLLIAAELEMPEKFIEVLRGKDMDTTP